MIGNGKHFADNVRHKSFKGRLGAFGMGSVVFCRLSARGAFKQVSGRFCMSLFFAICGAKKTPIA